jgi:pimeloyl-ACP methyl ester carboxylesterase
MKTKLLILACALFSITCNSAQKPISGGWEGQLNAGSTSLRIVFHFEQKDGSYTATMDSPDQGASDIACDKVTMKGDSIHVHVMAANGQYNGRVINDSVINGNWEQGGQKFEVTLKKSTAIPKKIAEVVYNKDTNCAETNITLETKTGKIFGTLCTPKKFDKIPVALIIAGSGPTDRDGNNNMGMKTDTYKIIAHKLSDAGIATVRYDKRGIAESKAAMTKEADIRFDNFINDAKDWVALLKADKRFSGVIIIGHSEGSLIGMEAATKDVNKYVSIAGAGESADKILKRQLSANMPEPGRDTAYGILDSLVAGRTVSHISPNLYNLFRPSVQPYLISWFKHDPQADIKKLSIPVLILQGTSDVQIDTTDARELSVANPKAKLDIIKGVNHTLRDVGDDKDVNMKSYSDPTIPLDENMVKDIVEFINGK